MKNLPPKNLIAILLLVAALLCGLRPAYACGPFAKEAIFSYTKHPDFPLDGFARGELGVIEPNYARSYLYVAYRYMSGLSFNPAEQQALLSLWRDRLAYDWQDKAEDSKETWLEARKKVKGASADLKIEVYRASGKEEYDSFLNCTADAFQNASQTLEERIKQFGAESAEVKDWLQAQDKVFANCSGGATIPDAATSTAQLIRADRAYQIAAANFYAMKFDEARAGFNGIAADSSSPWRETARYLIVRSLIRKASLGDEAHRNETLAEAQTELTRMLGEIKQGPLHDSAAKLSNLVKLRLHPSERLQELAASLMKKEKNDDLKQELWDYTILLDKFLGDGDVPVDKGVKKITATAISDDLSDWLRTFQKDDKESLEHSLERWQKTGSPVWLVAALTKADGKMATASSLIAASEKIAANSPAYATASFHAVRLLLESGDRAGALNRLDAILKQNSSSFPPSAINQFLHQRMLLSSNLEEFLRYAQRRPAAFSWGEDDREIPMEQADLAKDDDLKVLAGRTLFDSDATRIMNERFPLTLLQEAATNSVLPEHLRKRIALAAWTRAVLLNDAEAGKALASTLAALAPEMKQALDEYLSANTAANQKAAALYTILKFPGTRPFVDAGVGRFTPLGERDIFRDNWWCERSLDAPTFTEQEEESGRETGAAKASALKLEEMTLDFLTSTQSAAGTKERAALQALGTAPNYLAREVIAWANRTPNDPRIPEALHIVVMATRYGCANKETGPLSKAAWQLLHRRYANSVWAKKTPYWFKSEY